MNYKRSKTRQSIVIRQRGGNTFEVLAFVCGPLGLHRGDGLYRITHIPTGASVCDILHDRARWRILDRLANEIDWGGLELRDGEFILPPDYSERIPPAVRRIRAEETLRAQQEAA